MAVLITCLQNVMVLLVGGIFVAIAVEKSQLHRRLALKILLMLGTAPKYLLLGFMIPTFLCSMFISNTATTAMMLPILDAVLEQLRVTSSATIDGTSDDDGGEATGDASSRTGRSFVMQTGSTSPSLSRQTSSQAQLIGMETTNLGYVNDDVSPATTENQNGVADDNTKDSITIPEDDATNDNHNAKTSRDFVNLSKALTLCICYTANVGGTATLTGSPPNLILKGFADDIWAEKGLGESPVTYSTWMAFGLPIALINFALIYLWLALLYLGWRSLRCQTTTPADEKKNQAVRATIEQKYAELGAVTYAEVVMSVLFGVLVLLWFFRSPGFIDGWSRYFEDGYVSDSVSVMAVVLVLFTLPAQLRLPRDHSTATTLLTWSDVNTMFPWSIIWLVGGASPSPRRRRCPVCRRRSAIACRCWRTCPASSWSPSSVCSLP